MIDCIGYRAKNSFSALKQFKFERREAGAQEVEIAVLFCGVCHSDIHQAKNEWSNTNYPCVPGHEIVGRVSKIGTGVERFKVGEIVGVGCIIDSCRKCGPCLAGEENYCEGPNGYLCTYNGPFVPASLSNGGKNQYADENTFGGYSNFIVVPQDFVLTIPESINPAAAAPLLCAGITTYSALRKWNVKPGDRVGVIGLGGLGDIAVKLAKALGAHLTVFTTSKDKVYAAQSIGADLVVLQDDEDSFNSLKSSFDLILDTVPEKHDLNPFVKLLKRDKTLVVVGTLAPLSSINNQEIAFHRRSISGSLIGGLKETQEVLNFCAEHNIAPEIEIIDIEGINDAFKRVEHGDVRFRFVINMASLGERSTGSAN
jgi:uncharacterized zinc-type alcohol dehydrogenase-like protein